MAIDQTSRSASAQRIVVGETKPPAGTVASAIVALVVEGGGNVSRGDLLDAMMGAGFHTGGPDSTGRELCERYVDGAVRLGFLAAAAGSAA